MRHFFHNAKRWNVIRRSVSIVTLTTYLTLVFGLPLPAAVRKAGDQPYPCQNSPCGCLSAEQCWRSCCCTTPEQRFAWAREHGITPPGYAAQPQSSGWSTAPQRETENAPKKKSCCSHHQGESKPAPNERAPSDKDEKSKSAGFKVVLGIAAMKCQGLTATWTAAGLAPVPPAWFGWQSYSEPEAWILNSSIKATSHTSIPPLPPPRICA